MGQKLRGRENSKPSASHHDKHVLFTAHTPQELLAEFTSPTPLSPDTAAYLTERTRRLSLQTTNTTTARGKESQQRCTPPAYPHTSPSHCQPSKLHSVPNTPLSYKNPISSTPKSTLKLVIEGDSPPTSPTTMVPMLRLPVACQTPVSSDPDVTGTTLHTVATSSETLPQYPTLERSVMAEQEAELEEQEQCLEDQLLQEMMERLRERQTYIRYTPQLGTLYTSSVPLQDRTLAEQCRDQGGKATLSPSQ